MEGRIRVGTTSYIKPADILPNVRYLAPLVDDIELVLFESAEASNLPDERTIAELASLASEHDLTYTVHFPLDIFPGSRDEAERAEAAMMLNGIVSLTEELDPFGYVLHLTPDHYGVSPSHEVEAWLSSLDRSLEEFLKTTAIDPALICVETLSYPFAIVEELVRRYGLSVTLDIGHIWLMGYDSDEAARHLLPQSRICHLHGVADGTDHLGLDAGDGEAIERFLRSLVEHTERDGRERVLTLEIFSEREFEASLSFLRASRAMMGQSSGGVYGNH
ncbi:MAG TPA: cobamide remodeling phosphodiesterase CbiR [Sphaerochaeta sp.]|jgi:sugar phosphate isomerase/epimerase|nr:cobamide remodeling phosphodiesterase CbiR [Sphaerochaeta sp.]